MLTKRYASLSILVCSPNVLFKLGGEDVDRYASDVNISETAPVLGGPTLSARLRKAPPRFVGGWIRHRKSRALVKRRQVKKSCRPARPTRREQAKPISRRGGVRRTRSEGIHKGLVATSRL